jgi:nicotinate-nucleotide pyrophosphorylase (carboxylating)
VSSILLTPAIDRLIDLALEEDLGRGDVTTSAIIGANRTAEADIVAREPLVVAAIDVARAVFQRIDPKVETISGALDGQSAKTGDVLVSFRGAAASLLSGERTALNFLQRLCGIATLTRAFAAHTKGTDVRVTDTRKTYPGARALEKHAVRAGGGANHRFDLGSGVLIKDNHLVIAGSVSEAVRLVRQSAPHGLKIEVEVDTLEQLDQALSAGVDIVLLDNFETPAIEEAVRRVRQRSPRPLVEVSGGVTLDRMPELVRTGVDLISVGALTHSARAVDLSLEMRSR